MGTIEQTPLADRVHEALTVELMSGARQPGQRLKIDSLAREFGVSHTPIREALVRLEQTGFVRREARRGYVVAALLEAADISNLMDARLLIEPTMAELAVERTDDKFLTQLHETIDAMKHAGNAPDGESLLACWTADEAFHTLIAEQSGNRFIAMAHRSLGGQLQRFRIIGGAGAWHARAACSEHQKVFDAISAGQPSEAAATMSLHLSNAKSRALDDLRQASERLGNPHAEDGN